MWPIDLMKMSNCSQRRVAIIGAGVSGLSTAMNMIRVGIRPTVFEKEADVGGLWNDNIKPCWTSMRTNLSKFTTVFPDLPWPTDAPLFPKQHQVYEYLSSFVKQYLSSDIFLLKTEVINIELSGDNSNQWTVHYRMDNGDKLFCKFDFIVVAAGIFSSPQPPKDIADLNSFPGMILHSTEYHSPEQIRGKRVIIVGSSISAADIAADMAPYSQNILHIAPSRFWSLARYLPLKPTDPATPFLPIDMVIYRRSGRLNDDEIIFRNTEDYQRLNVMFRSLVGGDNPASSLSKDDTLPPIFVVSDLYTSWTRAGRISLKQGRLRAVKSSGELILDDGTALETTAEDILMLCTGYQPCLDFFSSNILDELSYVPEDRFCPIILHRNIFHPSLPGLAFVGMYRGPIWTVIELQARWVSATFAGICPMPSNNEQKNGIELEKRVRAQNPRPQFPHNDVLGVMSSFAKEGLGIDATNSADILVANNFRHGGPDLKVLAELEQLCEKSRRGAFLAGVLYHALYETRWNFERIISEQNSDTTVQGTSRFISSIEKPHRLIYVEEYDHSQSSNQINNPFGTPRDISLLHDESEDTLMVLSSINGMDEHILHTIYFQANPSMQHSGWVATGNYHCGEDQYSVSYLFSFTGILLSHFTITSEVLRSNMHLRVTNSFRSQCHS